MHPDGGRRPTNGATGQGRYPAILCAHARQTRGLTAALAEAGEVTRLQAVAEGVPPAVAEVTAGVVAPLLVGFALWVTAYARAAGLRRLYFVARDGEVMLDTARPLLAALLPDVECRYLYGSRQSWVLACSALREDVLDDWLAPEDDATLRTALARVDLTPEQAWAADPVDLLQPDRADQRLTAEQARELSSRLRRDPLRRLVSTRAADHLTDVVAYLRQEGLTDAVTSALVDAGWRGHSARALDRLVQAAGGTPPEHLFFGLFASTREVRRGPSPPTLVAWLFDYDEGRRGGAPIEQVNVVAETFFAARHGRVLRYRQVGDRRHPVLVAPTNSAALAWGLDGVRSTLAEVVRRVVPALSEEHLGVDTTAAAWELLHAFWMTPTRAEARAWGSFPWEEETFPPRYPIAEPLRLQDVVRRVLRGQPLRRHARSWPAGSRQVSVEPLRSLLLGRRRSAWRLSAPTGTGGRGGGRYRT